ncbi:MAG TPA: FUSC family protein, partial [Trebonia sp.]|nr:FUSC family protein [Trebonia sp.]
LVRIEDVAIGCAVSLVVGVLFWPRGVSSVVGDDLADAFRSGAAYLAQAVDWALSELMVPPSAALAAASAAVRLDDAVRGYLTEQGSKRLSKQDLWTLLNASSRLRLTAHALAGLRTATPAEEGDFGGACLPLPGSEEYAGAPACSSLRMVTADLASFYGAIADEVSHRDTGELTAVPLPALVGPAMPRHEGDAPETAATIAPVHQLPHPHLLWVQEHLHHLSVSAQTVSEPALRIAEIRRRPWWR